MALVAGQMTAAGLGQAAALPLTLAAIKSRYAVLEHAPAFYSLPSARLRFLARRACLEYLPAGSTLFLQGQAGDRLYVLASGRCEIVVATAPNHWVTVGVAGPGDALGEESAVLGAPCSASVRAIEDCELVSLDREALAAAVAPASEEEAELQRLARQKLTAAQLLGSWSGSIGTAAQGRTLAIYSPKGGTGRTTVTLNLAAQLARAHPGEVAVVDLSLPFNDVALVANLVPTSALALLGEVPRSSFEESLLSAMLPHPAGFLVLPGVLRAEHSDLVTVELVERAVEVLSRSFRFLIFDLAPQLSGVTLAVLEGVDQVLVLATAELSSLKDFKDVRRILLDVLKLPPSRVMLALNHRSPRSVIDRAAVESTLQQAMVCEFQFEGTKLEESAVRGHILSLSDPQSSIARATGQIAAGLDPQAAPLAASSPAKKVDGVR
jgi:pilus assembly protein CpaE